MNEKDKGRDIKADIYSRHNQMNGKYKAGNLGLDDLVKINNNDIFFLETLKVKADLADKMIAKAESQGKDTADPKFMRDLGKEINAVCTPLHRNEAIMTAIFSSLQLMVSYGIAIGIWGLVFKKSFLSFGFWGIIVGFLISLLSVGPVTASQRTREKIRDISFGANLMWGNLVIIVGVIGLVMLVIRLIIFK